MLQEKAAPDHDVEFTTSSGRFKQTRKLRVLSTNYAPVCLCSCPSWGPQLAREQEKWTQEEGIPGAHPPLHAHSWVQTDFPSFLFSLSLFPPSPVLSSLSLSLSFSLLLFLISNFISLDFFQSPISLPLTFSFFRLFLPSSLLTSNFPQAVPPSTALLLLYNCLECSIQ